MAKGFSTHRPRVTVVMATYNRSNILGYSIASALGQTVRDIEVIVVGDACTDDTEAVVSAIGDPRLRFINLAQNAGEQSGPNNAGVAVARAPVIAFLNHDDLWLPDHLEQALAILDADPDTSLVFGLGLNLPRDRSRPRLLGATTELGAYHPALIVPASLWVFRAQLAQTVGPWRSAWDIRRTPSYDWLIRTHRSGARLYPSRHLAAVIIPSRDNSYRDRDSAAQAQYAALAARPDGLRPLIIEATLAWEGDRADGSVLRFARESVAALVRRTLTLARVHPPSAVFWFRWWRKGRLLRRLRERRGLPSQ